MILDEGLVGIIANIQVLFYIWVAETMMIIFPDGFNVKTAFNAAKILCRGDYIFLFGLPNWIKVTVSARRYSWVA
jgi:hypothetical protein